ncbi:ABC transporter ATP-binding protein [Acidianus sp. HS-5]|uniref:ABC transporter ATP-binding protein n=1 Tax=Acidianus sp. HS-5 TaxID=2886040 RepID=UPI001F2F0982|nr:ABC transporter ATP-binding protein [Acidianus sp. HS-5]BDC17914.1 ABC transporter ATP-binding protein [Acidianus sp. HS-5]
MIRVENLVKYYGKIQALNGENFTVNDGEIVGFVGLNGAGKTTTIKIASGVIYPTSGDVFIDNYSITKDKKKASENVGWVPELPIYEQDVKALDYFVYIAGYYKIPTSEARSMGKKLFEEVGLSGRENDKLKNYSQGMKKRFALAVSLISNPKNFLFDEVLNGLDPEGMQFFKNLALKLKKEGKTVLFSSHILSEVESLADKVVFLHKGKIVKETRMEDLRKMISTNALRVVLNSPSEEALKACSSFGEPTLNNGVIIINNFKGDTEDVARVLKPYGVLEIGYVRQDLESLFFKIIGESQ